MEARLPAEVSHAAGSSPARHVIVVSRDDTDLYRYLRRAFAEVAGVEILLDRRRRERRQATGPHEPERRRGERRREPNATPARDWFVVVRRRDGSGGNGLRAAAGGERP